MIAIVDYGAGNVTSVAPAVEHLGRECRVTASVAALGAASHIIVPGVGNFRATEALAWAGLGEVITRRIARGVPVLGICLGMQWLFESSAEAPGLTGLGVFPGSCLPFPPTVSVRPNSG